jgi:membrane protease YdiL (CAAX protease family)
MSAAISRSPIAQPPPLPSTITRAPAGRRWAAGSRATLVHALLVALFLPIGGIAVGLLLRPYLPAPDSHVFDGSTGAFVHQLVRLGVGTTYIALALLLAGRLRWRDLGWRDLSLRQVALGAGGFLAVFAAFGVFAMFTSDYSAGGFLEAVASFTWRERLLGLLIGVSAALLEESLYRGYLQPALCKRLGATGGIVATAVLFSLMHIPTSLVPFIGRLLIGLGLGVLRGQDRPLWAPAIVHTLFWVVVFAL